MAPALTSVTAARGFGSSGAGPAGRGGGESTSIRRSPPASRRVRGAVAGMRRTPRLCASRSRARKSGSAVPSPPSRSASTGKRAITSMSPPWWSREACVATARASRSTPALRRRRATPAPGGPPSNKTAVPSGSWMSVESPWPTSRKRTVSRPGGSGPSRAGAAAARRATEATVPSARRCERGRRRQRAERSGRRSATGRGRPAGATSAGAPRGEVGARVRGHGAEGVGGGMTGTGGLAEGDLGHAEPHGRSDGREGEEIGEKAGKRHGSEVMGQQGRGGEGGGDRYGDAVGEEAKDGDAPRSARAGRHEVVGHPAQAS